MICVDCRSRGFTATSERRSLAYVPNRVGCVDTMIMIALTTEMSPLSTLVHARVSRLSRERNAQASKDQHLNVKLSNAPHPCESYPSDS